MKSYRLFWLISLIVLVLFSCHKKTIDKEKQFVHLNSSEVKALNIRHDLYEVILNFTIDKGYHIQLDSVTDSNLIPTTFKVLGKKDFELVSNNVNYKKEKWTFDNVNFFEVISERFSVILTFKIKDTKGDNKNLSGILTYQTCDDRKCYFPRQLSVNMTL